ncbi:MAG TPA: capsule assembly Wzi family protein [Candidatus Sulfotelmatobacter sp.]
MRFHIFGNYGGNWFLLLMALISASTLSVAQAGDQNGKPTTSEAKPRAGLNIAPITDAPNAAYTDATTGNMANPSPAAVIDREAKAGRMSLEKRFAPNIFADQKAFWTRPFHPKEEDIHWLIPFAAATSMLIGSDTSIEARLPTGATIVKRSQTFSSVGAGSLIGTAGGIYLAGSFIPDQHARETGVLSGEALVNSLAVSSAIQFLTGRERPMQSDSKGKFWQGGSSFPSNHAAAAWSVASVLAHEYPGPMTKILAYGLASAVSAARITGDKHFAADVFIGSAIGWYMGRQDYRAHHNPEVDGRSWAVLPSPDAETRKPANMGSPYVPLDSWVYAAIERLNALGHLQTAYLGLRPWTRMECARLVGEAQETIGNGSAGNKEVSQLLTALSEEFAAETARLNGGAPNAGAHLESLYSRVTGISGTPLRDGYHFGQTIINDYGRPYGEGFNSIEGFTSNAVAGPLAIALQGEYQHAPAVSSDAPTVLEATAASDNTLPLADGTAQINRFRLLNTTVGFTFSNVAFSFGQQSLWLGPSEAGPFLFSTNAAPVTMLRIDSTTPSTIPLLSYLLGPVRAQFFLGRLAGQDWEASPTLFGPNLASQPWLQGASVSFHPTANVEFGMGFTAQFGGQGNPFTWSSFLRTFYSHRQNLTANPAKRLSEFNFDYRVPGLRDWLEVYVDSMVIDEYSPIGSTRPSINPGVYLPRLPKLHKVDLRLEGLTTDLNWPSHFGPGAVYYDVRYRSGYTNDGNLIGSWVGRQGRGEQGWLTYWFSPRTYLQAEYRHNGVDREFLEGGQLQDFALRSDVMVSREFSVSGWLQHETWHFPVLSTAPKSNVAASLQLAFWPHWKARQNE